MLAGTAYRNGTIDTTKKLDSTIYQVGVNEIGRLIQI